MQTSFLTSPAQNAAYRIEGRLSHRQRLAARLGDGRDWEYTGECTELEHATGKCTCGHIGLRFLW